MMRSVFVNQRHSDKNMVRSDAPDAEGHSVSGGDPLLHCRDHPGVRVHTQAQLYSQVHKGFIR